MCIRDRSDNELCFIYMPVAQCCYVTMYWLLQTDSVNNVLWSCSSNAIMPPNIHCDYYYYYYINKGKADEALSFSTVGEVPTHNIKMTTDYCDCVTSLHPMCKVQCATPFNECRQGDHLPFLGYYTHRWTNHLSLMPSHFNTKPTVINPVLLFDQFQLMLLNITD